MTSLYQESDKQRPFDESNRIHKEYFTPFRRDYARVIHSASFRRLQGKTQIFPGFESDFFRNRLTHSLEVAQVAKSIAIILNEKHNLDIDLDLMETAAICHDIGHPPFGHNGELALHSKMLDVGGFEGNAQTLRVISKIEKKIHTGKNPVEDGIDNRCGLNLTYRALASVMKYDNKIPEFVVNLSSQPAKGYYACEEPLVNEIKEHVLRGYTLPQGQKFKTIECQIMDIADDIAYSTYDIEDAMKGGFINPISIVGSSDELLEKVQREVSTDGVQVSVAEIRDILTDIFKQSVDFSKPVEEVYQQSDALVTSGYLRTNLTSNLVHYCLSSIEFELNEDCPVLSKVWLKEEAFKQVEVLKLFIYFSVINATKLNIVRYRGRDILHSLFDILIEAGEEKSLLPADINQIYYSYPKGDEYNRSRIICDFISSMTDRYAIEFYARLKSDTPQSIFKPV
ncbi:MAG: dGTPase [Francisellaceae bacterium]|jgi:dGTPase